MNVFRLFCCSNGMFISEHTALYHFGQAEMVMPHFKFLEFALLHLNIFLNNCNSCWCMFLEFQFVLGKTLSGNDIVTLLQLFTFLFYYIN